MLGITGWFLNDCIYRHICIHLQFLSFYLCISFIMLRPRCSFLTASAASDGSHRESQAGHTPRDELHHTGEFLFIYCFEFTLSH